MICFDTSPVIWAVEGVATKGQESLPERARIYLEQLRQEKQRICIPAPVVAEYLFGFEAKDERDRQWATLETLGAFFAPLDQRSARLAADIRRGAPFGEARENARRQGTPVAALKIDALVVAIAVASGCTELVTHDAQVIHLAQGHIAVQRIPTPAPPGPLFTPQA